MFASELMNVVYSDEEGDESRMDTDAKGSDSWENFTLRFGKYKGTNLADMIKTGRTRGYLRYIMTWQDIRPHTAANIERALHVYSESRDARDACMEAKPTRAASMECVLAPPPLTRTDTQQADDHRQSDVAHTPPVKWKDTMPTRRNKKNQEEKFYLLK